MHREQELAADRVAVGAMAAAGYDPHALVDYLTRVQSRGSDAESPLPSLPGRLSNLGNTIKTYLPRARTHLSIILCPPGAGAR
jgi:Peptidase family M48